MAKSNPLEASLESYFAHRVRLVGGYSIKLAPTEAGVPDRLVMFPGGHMFLVELKEEHGTVSAIQRLWHRNLLARQGIRVYVITGRKGVIRWLRAVIETLSPTRSQDVG